MFMEENPLVSSWSCMLLAEHRPILMSLLQVDFDFTIWEEVMK